MRRWNSRPNDKRQKNHFFLPPFLILNFADGPANQKRKKEKKKCSTLSAVKKRKKNFGERQSVEVVNLWNARGVWLACLCEWEQSGTNVKHTHERERETHVMSTGSWLKPVVCACHCFIECRKTACPVAPAGKGNIYIKEPKERFLFLFLGPRKRMRLLSVLNYLAFEIFAHPPLCCICLLIQASSSYPPFPSHSFVCLFLRAWYINWQDMI